MLFKRKGDIQADVTAAGLEGTSVGGFYDSRSATGHDHMGCASMALPFIRLTMLGGLCGKFLISIVKTGQVYELFGVDNLSLQRR